MVAPLEPEVGERVSQVWFEVADQEAWLVDTVTLVLPAKALGDQVVAESDTVAAVGIWAVTVYCPDCVAA